MYLVISPVDDNISKYGPEILCIAPTILPHRQRQRLVESGCAVRDNEDVYFEAEELASINEYVLGLYRRIMKSVASFLNDYHKVDHSQKFWNIAVGRRVYDMITKYFIAYRQLNSIKDRQGALVTTIINSERPEFDRDYLSLLNNQYIIYSHILCEDDFGVECIDCGKKLYELDDVFLKRNEMSYDKYSNKKKKNMSKLGIFKRVCAPLFVANNRTEIILDTPYLQQMERLTIASGFRIKGCYDLFTNMDWRMRGYKNYNSDPSIDGFSFSSNDTFETIIKNNIWKWIPAVFTEHYSRVEELIYPLYSNSKAKVVGSANSYLSNDVYNIWSAHLSEKGAKVIAMDHGGTVCVDYNAEHEYETYDFFYTYGNIKSFPRHTNFLNGVCNTHLITDKEYFFSKYKGYKGNMRILYFEDYSYNPTPYLLRRSEEVGIKDAMRQRFQFIDTIGEDNLCHLTLRAFSDFDHYESSSEYALKYTNVERHVMTDKSFVEAVVDADICVSDAVNGTPWQELLAVDKPVLLLINMKGQVFTDEGSNMIDRMKECNLIFEDGIALARYIESIKDPLEWWNEPGRHSMIEEFCYKYMYIPEKNNRYKYLARCLFAAEKKEIPLYG